MRISRGAVHWISLAALAAGLGSAAGNAAAGVDWARAASFLALLVVLAIGFRVLPRSLARPEPGPYLRVLVGGEAYGIPIQRVRLVPHLGTMALLPVPPPGVRGVVSVGPWAVPVVDLGARLGRAETVVGRGTCIVVVEIGRLGDRTRIGLLVETASGVVRLERKQIGPPPGAGTGALGGWLLGRAWQAGNPMLLLDVDRILGSDDLRLASIFAREGAQRALDARATWVGTRGPVM